MVEVELVERFRQYVGRETFRRFVFVLNRHLICVGDFILEDKNRLLYWQQLKWDGFVNENPAFRSMTFPDVRNAFCRCHIHDRPLLPDIVPVVSDFRAPRGWMEAVSDTFPFSNVIYWHDSGECRDSHDVKYCPDCRDGLVDWNQRQPFPFDFS